MKKLLTLLVLGLFVAGIAGCEASAKVGDDTDGHGSYSKKTTTIREPDGDRTTKTEIRHND